MKKVTKLVLMLCLILSGALCHAYGTARTENKKSEGIILEVKNATLHGSSDKSGSIVPTLNGHMLTIVFTENLGEVAVEISSSGGFAMREKRLAQLDENHFLCNRNMKKHENQC